MFFFLLSASDEENFCATVPKDGRSYSPTLFSQTVRVLKKINKPGDMIVAFGLLADKIKVWFGLENVCQRQHENTSLFYESVFTVVNTGGNIENLYCHSASVLVPCRPTAARRGDIFRCPRWVLGSNYVYSDARSCSSPILQCHSWPINYSKAPPQVGYLLQNTEILSRLYEVGNIGIHLTCFCALFLVSLQWPDRPFQPQSSNHGPDQAKRGTQTADLTVAGQA